MRALITGVIPGLFLMAYAAAGISPACAEDISPEGGIVRLNAEQIRHDKERNLIIATGKVEVMQGGRILLADEMTLNQVTDTVTATGHVTLLESSGEVIFADYAKMTDGMKNGIIRNLRSRLVDGSLMAANGALRRGNRTEMSKAVYSPCKLCEEDPSRPPLWQIKANRVIHDKRTHDIEYKDAFLEMFGIPVFYTPYLSHPDPTVKRRSGFLIPRLQNSSLLGFIVGVPYYYEVNPHMDVTVEPIYTTKQGPVIAGEIRQRFTKGEIEVSGSFTQGDRIGNGNIIKKDQNRGHIRSRGRFDIDRTWRMGFDVDRATDDTYLRKYGFQYTDVLESRLFAEGFRGRTYAALDGYLFQDQRPNVSRGDVPKILPVMDYNFVGEPGRKGDYWTLNANVMNLLRASGTDSRRLSVGGGWHLPYTGANGHVFDLSATVRGDVYFAGDLPTPNRPGITSDETSGRLFPQIAANWRYPLEKRTGTTHQLLEPIVSVVAATNGGNPWDIPNEDSLAFEFDDSDLFTPNRFVGLDRVEGGQRVDYGLKMGTYGSSGGSATAFIGQSFRLREDSTFITGSGLEDHFSDIVGRVQVSPGDYLNLLYRFRLEKDDYSPVLSDLAFSAGKPILRINANYISIDSGASSGSLGKRNEIIVSASSNFMENWTLTGYTNRDLTAGGSMTYAGGALAYLDECFGATLSFSRSFTRDRDIEPTDTITLNLFLKHLGQFQTQQVFAPTAPRTVQQRAGENLPLAPQ